MKKISIVLLVVLGLLTAGSAVSVSSSSHMFPRISMAEADGGG